MEDEVNEDPEIRQLLQADPEPGKDVRLARVALIKARRQVGQRDTLAFLFVKIWAALAKVLAPVFALLGERQAEATLPKEITDNINAENKTLI